jgi:hypothetical protein
MQPIAPMRSLLLALAFIVMAPAFAQAGTPSNDRPSKSTVQTRKAPLDRQKIARRPAPRPPVPGTPAALRAEWMD